MRISHPLVGLLCLALLPQLAFADYGWIPQYHKLNLRGGLEFYRSSQNFDYNGNLVPLGTLTQPAQLTDWIFWLEPEMGIAEDWAASFHVNFFNSSIDSQTTGLSYLTGIGFGDTRASLKWAVLPSQPVLTFEAWTKIPTGTYRPASPTDLVLGEGNFDLGLKLHTGNRHGNFLFSLTPGIVARFGGYATAATGDAAIQLQFSRAYFRVFAGTIYSFTDALLYDSSYSVHDAPGTGGSYSRLNPSPIGFWLGGKFGIKLMPGLSFEAAVSRALAGMRYPQFLSVSSGLLVSLDLFEPVKPVRVHEVPFEGEAPAQFPE